MVEEPKILTEDEVKTVMRYIRDNSNYSINEDVLFKIVSAYEAGQVEINIVQVQDGDKVKMSCLMTIDNNFVSYSINNPALFIALSNASEDIAQKVLAANFVNSYLEKIEKLQLSSDFGIDTTGRLYITTQAENVSKYIAQFGGRVGKISYDEEGIEYPCVYFDAGTHIHNAFVNGALSGVWRDYQEQQHNDQHCVEAPNKNLFNHPVTLMGGFLSVLGSIINLGGQPKNQTQLDGAGGGGGGVGGR